MSGSLVDRITAVLRDELERHGLDDMGFDEPHVAERIAEALQLTQELRVTEDGEQVAWPPSMKHARHIVEHPIGDSKPVIEARWGDCVDRSSWRTGGFVTVGMEIRLEVA